MVDFDDINDPASNPDVVDPESQNEGEAGYNWDPDILVGGPEPDGMSRAYSVPDQTLDDQVIDVIEGRVPAITMSMNGEILSGVPDSVGVLAGSFTGLIVTQKISKLIKKCCKK